MSKKTRNILLIIYLVAFIMTCTGASLAYFTIVQSENVSAKADINSITMSSLTFNAGNPISIRADMTNFIKDLPDLFGQTTASATLVKGSESDEVTYHYNVYLDIDPNQLEYSNEGNPELILTITDPMGKELMSVKDLEHVNANGVSGFDITKKTGRFVIAQNQAISADNADPQETQTWRFKLTFVNLNSSQDINKGKVFNGVISIEAAEEG